MAHSSPMRGKRVMVTGHTGFKGSWLTLLLHRMGAEITGYSLPAPTSPSLFVAAGIRDLVRDHHEADVRDAEQIARVVAESRPDVIMHLAAQPLVRRSYRNPIDTFSTNVMGTVSVLDAVRLSATPCVVIVVTSDKCYEPHADGHAHDEADAMGGCDPYSASKGAAELAVAAYRRSYFSSDRIACHGVQVATVRAGNVIGGGDWAEDRIVPDIVRHLSAHQAVPVRNPSAIRPWQHVLEPLSGYLALAEAMITDPCSRWCSAWNFGPAPGEDITVGEFVEVFAEAWGGGQSTFAQDRHGAPETAVLRLAIDKALARLPWRPRLSVRESIRRTAAWFKAFGTTPHGARSLCDEDISFFEAASPTVVIS